MAAVLSEQPMPLPLLHLLLRSFYAEHHTARRALTQNMKLNTNKRYLTHFIPPSTFPMSAGCSVSFLCLCNEIKTLRGLYWVTHTVTIAAVRPVTTLGASRTTVTLLLLLLLLSLSPLSLTHSLTPTRTRAPTENTAGSAYTLSRPPLSIT